MRRFVGAILVVPGWPRMRLRPLSHPGCGEPCCHPLGPVDLSDSFAHCAQQTVGSETARREACPGLCYLDSASDLQLVPTEWNGETGTPCVSAFCGAPMPPCVTAHTARCRIGACGMNEKTRAFGGGVMPAVSWAGNVATTYTFSPESASSAQRTSLPSSWNSDDVVTRTIGWSTSSSQGGGSTGGSQSHGPTIRTFEGQSERGY
jgi:hypothetical protein